MLTGVSTAAARARTGELRGRAPEILPLVAVCVLVVHYYLARADRIGTASGWNDWLVVTAAEIPATLHYVGAALLLAALPVLAARVLCGLLPQQVGLGAGCWRAGLGWILLGIPVALAAGRIAAGSPAMRAVYPLDPTVTAALTSIVPHALRNFLYYGGWEVLFRGVLLLGLAPRIGGSAANAVQSALAVAAHFGRPFTETVAALPGSLLFGGVTLRVRSVWPAAVVHWLVGTSMEWFLITG